MRRRSALPAVFTATVVALLSGGCAWLTQASMAPPATSGTTGAVGAYGTPSTSANGRYIAFAAHGDTRLPGATDAIFVLDTVTNKVVDASVSSTGNQADDSSAEPAISADGRYVAFDSFADNLDPSIGYFGENVYVRDLVAGTTKVVSVATDGTAPDGDSYTPSISNDGRYIGFLSDAETLVDDDDNIATDLFIRDQIAGTTIRGDLDGTGTQLDDGVYDGVISGNGKFVAFTTDSPGVASDDNDNNDVYRRNLSNGGVLRATSTTGQDAAISSDGRWIAYDTTDSNTPKDTNNHLDVYLRDMNTTSDTGRVLVSAGVGNAAAATGNSMFGSISDDGRFVAFNSTANLTGTDVNGATPDVYARDTVAKRTYLAGTTMQLAQPAQGSNFGHITEDGKYVAFLSSVNLTGSDKNGTTDVFLRTTLVPEPLSVSPTSIKRGTTATLTVSGNNFFGPAQAVVAGVSATTVTVNSEHQETVQVTIPATVATGPADVYVANSGTGPGTTMGASGQCASCVTITP